jgi:predicted nucleic acid-binding protein
MSNATATSRLNVTRLVVDTDVVSFIFKWHPEFAPQYINLVRGYELVISFMTVAEMRQGAINARWGRRKLDVLDEYLNDFAIVHSDGILCSKWAQVRDESMRKGKPISVADAWIATTALVLTVPLVTNNESDYRHIGDLELITAN